MNWIDAQPLHTYYAAYVDPVKSLPHRTPTGIENPKALAFWIPEQRYIANLQDYLDLIKKIKTDEFVINDPFLGRPIIRFYVEKGKSPIYDGTLGNGMIRFQYTEDLMAYRKREDGLLGVESISGLLDTRLSTAEKIKSPHKFPVMVRSTTKEDANFSNFSKLKEKHDKDQKEKGKVTKK